MGQLTISHFVNQQTYAVFTYFSDYWINPSMTGVFFCQNVTSFSDAVHLMCNILYETGSIQWMFSQHCGYWWPGAKKHRGLSSHSADYAPMCFLVFKGYQEIKNNHQTDIFLHFWTTTHRHIWYMSDNVDWVLSIPDPPGLSGTEIKCWVTEKFPACGSSFHHDDSNIDHISLSWLIGPWEKWQYIWK